MRLIAGTDPASWRRVNKLVTKSSRPPSAPLTEMRSNGDDPDSRQVRAGVVRAKSVLVQIRIDGAVVDRTPLERSGQTEHWGPEWSGVITSPEGEGCPRVRYVASNAYGRDARAYTMCGFKQWTISP